LDAQVDAMLESKMQTSNAVLVGGDVSTGPAAKISVEKLLQSLLANVS
jgi:hypothetical protein